MKTRNIYLSGCLALLTTLSSCTKMNDTQEKYLEWGEKIYAAKIDSAFALSGYHRQVIDIYYSSPRIANGMVVYNLNKDTLKFNMPEDGSRHFSFPINDLEEAEYNYTLFTFDKDGNKSLPTEISGKVYGRFYGDYLVRRAIEKVDTIGGFLIYTKGASDAEGINVTYTDWEGRQQVRYFQGSEPATILDAEPGSKFTYTTVYRPDATAVDTLESLPGNGQFPFISQIGRFQAGMKVFDSPSNTKDEFGWEPQYLYDGITEEDRGWHTWFNDTWPHSMTLELNKSFQIDELRIYQRLPGDKAYKTGNPRKFTLLGTNETPNAEGSNDGWDVIGKFEIIKPDDETEAANQAKAGHSFQISDLKNYRYVRILVTDTWSGEHFTHFTELKLFGIPQE